MIKNALKATKIALDDKLEDAPIPPAVPIKPMTATYYQSPRPSDARTNWRDKSQTDSKPRNNGATKMTKHKAVENWRADNRCKPTNDHQRKVNGSKTNDHLDSTSNCASNQPVIIYYNDPEAVAKVDKLLNESSAKDAFKNQVKPDSNGSCKQTDGHLIECDTNQQSHRTNGTYNNGNAHKNAEESSVSSLKPVTIYYSSSKLE